MLLFRGASFKFMAIDPGYDRCGFVVGKVFNNSVRFLDYGYITSNKKDSITTRLLEVILDIKQLLGKYKPRYVFVEDVYFSVNKKTAINVAKVIGAIEFVALEAKAEVFVLSPNTVKKTVTGQGMAKKQQVEYMVKQLYKQNFNFEIDDVADAFAIAYAGLVELLQS